MASLSTLMGMLGQGMPIHGYRASDPGNNEYITQIESECEYFIVLISAAALVCVRDLFERL